MHPVTRARDGEEITGCIRHWNAGAHYTANRYTERLTDAGTITYIARFCESNDSDLIESVIGL